MTIRRLALSCALTAVAAGIGLTSTIAQARPDEPGKIIVAANGRDDHDRNDHGHDRDDDDRDHDRGRHGHPREPIKVKVIGFNDYHGNLQSPGTFGVNTVVPAAQRPAVGGAEYLAAYVAQLKSQNTLNVVVGAGDFIGASPLISALFFDEPAVETLNRIGVEFNAVGNHEFDKGSAELKRLQNGGCKLTNSVPDPNSCKGLGSQFAGHLRRREVQVAVGQRVRDRDRPHPAAGLRHQEFHGVKVAFIGMTLKGTPAIVTPAGVAGLEFRDEADTVNALIPRLRAQGVDAIVVLMHQGGFQTEPERRRHQRLRRQPEERRRQRLRHRQHRQAPATTAVDLVISGHTHAAYNCSANTVDVKNVNGAAVSTPRPTGLPNSAGRLIPVTSASAFGRC